MREEIQCPKCGVLKPIEAFYESRKWACKVCIQVQCKEWKAKHPEYMRDWHAANAEQETLLRKQYRAQNAEQLRKKQKAYRAANRKKVASSMSRWSRENAEHRKAYDSKYRAENSERIKAKKKEHYRANLPYIKERYKQWAKENIERVRAFSRRRRAMRKSAEGSHTRAEWHALVAIFEGHCVCCREHFGLKGLTEDHVVPLALGGSDFIGNIQPLCLPCNSSKGNRHSTDYRDAFGSGSGVSAA